MLHYHIYGVHLASTIVFPQLVKEKDESTKVDILIEEGNVSLEIIAKPDNIRWEFGSKYTWFVNNTAWFEITNGYRILYQKKPNANEQYLRSFLLGLATAMLFMQRNQLAVHCSAVSYQSRGLLIAGDSGTGKSTLTHELLKEGYTFIADDMVIMNKECKGSVMAYPAFPYQKLCRDAVLREGYDLDTLIYINEEKDKFYVPYQHQFSIMPVPVKTMVILASYDGKTIQNIKIDGIDKVKAIYKNLFLRHLLAKEEVDPFIFQQCLEMAADIDIQFILRPSQGDTVKQVKETVLSCL